jgi:predicted nucleic-acid-binding Zn-ribbon protein
MKRGSCVKCGQPTVFAARNGVAPGGKGSKWMVAGAMGDSVMRQGIDVDTFACAACGYFENYADLGALVGATGGWTKVETQA